MTPTIADVLGVRLGYRADGARHSAARRAGAGTVSLDTRDFSSVVRISARRWEARRPEDRRRRLREFGSGAQRPVHRHRPTPRPARPEHDEPAPRGRRRRRARRRWRTRRELRRVRRASGRRARPDRGRPERRAARSAPGSRRGGERPDRGGGPDASTCDGDPREHYSLMVPEASLHDGRNLVEVFEVDGQRDAAAPGARLSGIRAFYISPRACMRPARGRRWPLSVSPPVTAGAEATRPTGRRWWCSCSTSSPRTRC